MYKKLVCFDFDGTLIHTPTPELGMPEWERQTGLSWGGRGWWGNPESLNLNIFHPPVNQWVYKHFLEETSSPESYVFLATGRLFKLKNQVLDILKLHDIKFHDVFCNTGGETLKFKCHLFETIIKENPHATEFTIYEDRHDHIQDFIVWAKQKTIKINIIDVVNKKKIIY
jgi:hydroxymethylpyrimidine pyrophosphatase-like HAD family hydrolase